MGANAGGNCPDSSCCGTNCRSHGRDCTDYCIGYRMNCTEDCCSNLNSSSRCMNCNSILIDSYCTGGIDCCMGFRTDCIGHSRDCMGYCNPDSSNGCLDCSSIPTDSYYTDYTDRCRGYCNSGSSFARYPNSLVDKSCIAPRLDCYLLKQRLPQERQLTLVLWHYASSKLRFSPLRHYTLRSYRTSNYAV